MRRRIVAVTTLAAGLAITGTANAERIGSATQRGESAAASAFGIAQSPQWIKVRVTARPRQRVTGNWEMVCDAETGAGSTEGHLRGRGSFSRRLRMSTRQADRCTVAAIARLKRGGRIRVTIHAKKRKPPAPAPAPTPTPVPAPAPAPAPGSTRANPIPIGQPWASNGWTITVISTTPDATAQVLAENMFNDPPVQGGQFFIATIRATYLDPGADSFDADYRLRVVGQSGVEYKTFDATHCGVIPNPISDNNVFTGGTVEGNVCWQVSAADAGSLVMYDSPFLSASSARMFYALH